MADYSNYSVEELIIIAKEYERRFNLVWEFINEVDKHYFVSWCPEADNWFDMFNGLTPPL